MKKYQENPLLYNFFDLKEDESFSYIFVEHVKPTFDVGTNAIKGLNMVFQSDDLSKYRIIMVFGLIKHGKSTALNALGSKFSCKRFC